MTALTSGAFAGTSTFAPMPGLKTVNGIATAGGNKAAWFKETEGNILAIIQAL